MYDKVKFSRDAFRTLGLQTKFMFEIVKDDTRRTKIYNLSYFPLKIVLSIKSMCGYFSNYRIYSLCINTVGRLKNRKIAKNYYQNYY